MQQDNQLDLSDNDDDDHLELCAWKIAFKTNNPNIVDPELRHFYTCEVGERDIDEDDEEDASVLVEFDAEISRAEAIGTLKTIIAHIEAHGLPPTSIILPCNVAELIKKMEDTNPDEIRKLVRRLGCKNSERP